MPETTEAYDFRGRTLIDAEREKIGKIDELYYDREGGQPEWALVNTGLFGTKTTFVPIRSANPSGEEAGAGEQRPGQGRPARRSRPGDVRAGGDRGRRSRHHRR